MLPGGLVEEGEEGGLWREEKNKVGQGGILETYIQPGDKRTMVMEEEEGDGTGGVDSREEQMRIGPSFYFDKEDEQGGEIAKRAWNSYFTGGFGKRGGDTGEKWGKAQVLARIRPGVFVRPVRSLPGAFSLFDGFVNVTLPICHSTSSDITLNSHFRLKNHLI